MRLLRSLTLLACTAAFVHAEVASMTGTWALNVKRSDWGKKPSPARVDLVIEHNEPAFKYRGTSQPPDERGPSTFEFTGKIDSKEYPVKEGATERKARFKRLSDHVVEGVYLGPDGKTAEVTKTTVSRDGKTLEREVRIELPDGTTSRWKEIYEKQR
jgi:hypothetical protein